MKDLGITLLSMLLTASTFQIGSAANEQLTGSTAPILNRLQKNPGKLADGTFYVPAAAGTFQWGWIPNQNSKAPFEQHSGYRY